MEENFLKPSDFTVKLKANKGCCGCSKTYPLKNATSGQMLAYIDRFTESKIFETPLEYWKTEVKKDLDN